jgi:hypothetical protein
MVQNAAYNRGKPFYVTFRPIFHSVVRLKDDELEEYNKYNLIVEELEYQFDQLEELKQDVFDLRLELKLAKDKIKGGNFNMVKIYLDGLTPRIQKVWDKIAKKPKKYEIRLVSDEELKADLEKAKEAKAKAKAEEQATQATAAPAEAEEEEVKMDPDQLKDNLASIEKLFRSIDESIAGKDFFAVNDRIIELQSIPLPKEEKKKLKKRIEDAQKKIEDAKKAAEAPKAPAVATAAPAGGAPAASVGTAANNPAAASTEAKSG